MTAPGRDPRMTDLEAVLAEYWPYDGPHTRETVRTAAEMVPALLRYITNGTDPVNGRVTLETAGDVHRTVTALHKTVGYLPQLLAQLERRVSDLAARGLLRDERDPVETYLGRETARDVVAALGEVLPAVNFLSARLADVQRHSTHLGTAASSLVEGGPR